jgi:hypothetical protein
MNLKKTILAFAALTLSAGIETAIAQCKSKVIVKTCKPRLEPFKYDGAAVNDIIIDGKEKVMELEFAAYSGQEYKLVFCPSETIKEEIKIQIFDKRKNIKSRKLIFESSSMDATSQGFEPPKSGNYFIEYLIPAGTPETKSEGCMVFLIGYKSK